MSNCSTKEFNNAGRGAELLRTLVSSPFRAKTARDDFTASGPGLKMSARQYSSMVNVEVGSR